MGQKTRSYRTCGVVAKPAAGGSDPAAFKANMGDKGPDVVKKHGGQFLVRTDKITPLRAAEPAI
jgi:hypothetical protein